MWYIKSYVKLIYYIFLLKLNTIQNSFVTRKWFNTTSQNSIGDIIGESESEILISKHRDLFFKRGKIMDKFLKLRDEVEERVYKNGSK